MFIGTSHTPCSYTVFDGVVRPTAIEFETYLPEFLMSNPGIDCPKGGHAAYAHVSKYIIKQVIY